MVLCLGARGRKRERKENVCLFIDLAALNMIKQSKIIKFLVPLLLASWRKCIFFFTIHYYFIYWFYLIFPQTLQLQIIWYCLRIYYVGSIRINFFVVNKMLQNWNGRGCYWSLFCSFWVSTYYGWLGWKLSKKNEFNIFKRNKLNTWRIFIHIFLSKEQHY